MFDLFVFISLCQGVARQAQAAALPPQLTSPSPRTLCQTSPIPPARTSSTMLTSSTKAALRPNTA